MCSTADPAAAPVGRLGMVQPPNLNLLLWKRRSGVAHVVPLGCRAAGARTAAELVLGTAMRS